MVYRIYVEKKEELANEARELAGEARDFLGIQSLEKVRILNRYDVENIDKELFDQAVRNVCRAAQLASIRLRSGQVSRGSAGEYQADERAGVARLSWRVSGR